MPRSATTALLLKTLRVSDLVGSTRLVAVEDDADRLGRFLGEVRAARQVTHLIFAAER